MRRAGKPCFTGSGLTVHADRDHRIAAIEGQLDREAAVPSVDRRREDLLRVGLHARFVQQVGQQHTLPDGGADQVATHLVRDAGDGDRPLDLRAGQQVVVGEPERPVDASADVDGPLVEVDPGHRERGVDQVEVVVRCEERRDRAERRSCGDLEVHAVDGAARRHPHLHRLRRCRHPRPGAACRGPRR